MSKTENSGPAAARRLLLWALGDRPADRVVFAIVALGCALRVLNFLGGRSLWLDEAMVADSIAHRDWSGLLTPLTYNQVAPLGWLMLERLSFLLFGGADLSLRVPALLAGLASLLLFADVARKSYGTFGAAVAVAAFAFSNPLVYYSAEVKPYGFDVLAAVVALALAARWLQGEAWPTWRGYLAAAALGLASLALSFPAAFVLAGLGAALCVRAAMKRRWGHAGAAAAVSAIWLIAFVALLQVTRHGAEANLSHMTYSWRGAYAPLASGGLGGLKWYPKALTQTLQYMFGAESIAPWLLATAVGAIILVRRRSWLAVAFLAPLATALAASGLRLYPFSERMLLFALPALMGLAALGVEAATSRFKPPPGGAIVAAALLLFGSVELLWGNFTYYPAPYATEHALPVMRAMATERNVDAVFVNFDGVPAFRYYRDRAGLRGVPLFAARRRATTMTCALDDAQEISRNRRVWVFYSHAGRGANGTPSDVLLNRFLDVAGRQTRTMSLVSVSASLYEFGPDGAQRISALRNLLSARDECGDDAAVAPE